MIKLKFHTLSFALLLICMIAPSCSGLYGPGPSVAGKWGMVSGGIKVAGVFTGLDKTEGSYYKTMEFREDGTFTETCGDSSASGTYSVSGSTITYSYTDVKGSGPVYFAPHRTGVWTFHFWNDAFFTLYDFNSLQEISMSFERID